MQTAILFVIIFISLVIIIISFLMSPDSNAFSGALVGSGDLELFKTSKERGSKKFLKYAMFGVGIVLLSIALIFRIFIG
ncbi:preprotein translocase subunit SecG [Mycoplasmopsis pullorum]|uniref:preprotein translocase subunit SecG n=1 Tax=Mycoplasmopsis pullorum TaxID=48003 RepID=UPI00111A6E9A|nr:preprotein translocase subunit SecG [Mycoplasmopsis pullorum]TNK82417.1 preprotein translocase subunit SecG [Mycoplasmopsis pullorum]TNK82812.1 preprotein translocase subunit SecG [Mycoplasmopsis pullorum]TNK84893.1 preprotein translocase subunit SecG [Mycoplasmopsis pullorum]TNK85237.1 preprotein translocase subunit SecG [Mycoplasmopsis pullorum]TNK86081.1 preprotein translocase subunit SecG [Mycoplasmopsis pullorum]